MRISGRSASRVTLSLSEQDTSYVFTRFSLYYDKTNALGDPQHQIRDCHVAKRLSVIQPGTGISFDMRPWLARLGPEKSKLERCFTRTPMSALGHERTERSEFAMSALPPKADITERSLARLRR